MRFGTLNKPQRRSWSVDCSFVTFLSDYENQPRSMAVHLNITIDALSWSPTWLWRPHQATKLAGGERTQALNAKEEKGKRRGKGALVIRRFMRLDRAPSGPKGGAVGHPRLQVPCYATLRRATLHYVPLIERRLIVTFG